MINNRQAGRRRGRGGQQQRPQGGGGRPEQGNRIDNRARGNASQLLEKYRNLASDSQRQGDRVTTEYYLQFADHYFRVLNESRPRNEDQPQRRQRDDFEDDGDGDEGFDEVRADDGRGEASRDEDRRDHDGRQQREPRAYVEDRSDRDGRGEGRVDREQRPDRDARGDRDERRERRPERRPMATEQDEQPQPQPQPVAAQAPAFEADAAEDRPRRPRRLRSRDAVPEQDGVADAGDERGLADRLPPAIAPVSETAAEGDAPAPRRRGRRPRTEANDDGTIVAA